MKILFVLSKRGVGGTVQLAAHWTRCLQAMGVEVVVVSLTSPNPSSVEPAALRELETMTGTVRGLGHRGVRDCLRTMGRLRAVIRAEQPDAIHSFLPLADGYSSLAKSGLGVPLVGTVVTSSPTTPNRSRQGLAQRVTYRMGSPNAWVVLGEVVKERAVEAGYLEDRLRIVRPGLNADAISSSASPLRRAELGLAPGDIAVISVGRLVESKGHDVAIRALSKLPSHFHLLIAGRGPRQADLEQLAQELGVGSRVHFLGPRDDIPRVLATCDLYVSATQYEGLVGYATLEAVVVGLPVVVSDLPEIREVLDGTSVLFVPAGDIDGFRDAIDSGSRLDRVSDAATRVRELFDDEAIALDLLATYRGEN